MVLVHHLAHVQGHVQVMCKAKSRYFLPLNCSIFFCTLPPKTLLSGFHRRFFVLAFMLIVMCDFDRHFFVLLSLLLEGRTSTPYATCHNYHLEPIDTIAA